jgi:hypothetical protein
MREASFLQVLENGICPRQVDSARCEVVATMDGLVARDFYQLNSLAVTWLETHGGTGSNIKTVAISFNAIEFELRICFDKVVVRSDLLIDQ